MEAVITQDNRCEPSPTIDKTDIMNHPCFCSDVVYFWWNHHHSDHFSFIPTFLSLICHKDCPQLLTLTLPLHTYLPTSAPKGWFIPPRLVACRVAASTPVIVSVRTNDYDSYTTMQPRWCGPEVESGFGDKYHSLSLIIHGLKCIIDLFWWLSNKQHKVTTGTSSSDKQRHPGTDKR